MKLYRYKPTYSITRISKVLRVDATNIGGVNIPHGLAFDTAEFQFNNNHFSNCLSLQTNQPYFECTNEQRLLAISWRVIIHQRKFMLPTYKLQVAYRTEPCFEHLT